MTNVLVCVKRVPDVSGEVALTADGHALDTGQLGFTISDHELCAVELAVRIATDTGGTAAVATIGTAEAVEQLRNALAIGCTAATHIVADPATLGPADVARELAAVARDHDLVLLGNDAADSGDFQVGIRLAYELGRPVVNGVSTVEVEDGVLVARGEGPDGHETFRLPPPAVVTILEGGVEPRYPSVPGRMKAKKVAIEERELTAEPVGPQRVSYTLPPPVSSDVQILGEGAAAAPAVVDLFERIGVISK
jgi:electron transfer flavoprotein beta subunit